MGATCSSASGGKHGVITAHAPHDLKLADSRPLEARVATSRKTGALDLSGMVLTSLAGLQGGGGGEEGAVLHGRVRTLLLSRNALVSVDTLAHCPALARLQRLTLSDNPRLTTLPALAGALPSLAHLEAARCDLAGLPTLPRSLRSLHLQGNSRLGAALLSGWALGGCSGGLRTLDLSGCGLTALPAALATLAALVELTLDDNLLQSLELGAADGGDDGGVPGWASLPRLTALSARRCRLAAHPRSIPQALLQDSAVTTLQLGGNADLTQGRLLALPGMDAFIERRRRALSRGATGDGGGAASLGGGALCGVEG